MNENVEFLGEVLENTKPLKVMCLKIQSWVKCLKIGLMGEVK